MKQAISNIFHTAVLKFRQAKAGGMNIKFDGSPEDYQKNILDRVNGMDKKCSVQYTNSYGAKVTLTFNQVVERLTRLSFDPYDCAEKRRGASGSEMSSCYDGDSGNSWYDAEQVIRNTVGKSLPIQRRTAQQAPPLVEWLVFATA